MLLFAGAQRSSGAPNNVPRSIGVQNLDNNFEATSVHFENNFEPPTVLCCNVCGIAKTNLRHSSGGKRSGKSLRPITVHLVCSVPDVASSRVGPYQPIRLMAIVQMNS